MARQPGRPSAGSAQEKRLVAFQILITGDVEHGRLAYIHLGLDEIWGVT